MVRPNSVLGGIMIYTPLTKKAINVMFEAHKNQMDKSGVPYVFHPFHLAEQMADEATTICALLHDVVEDTDCTFDDLANAGFPAPCIEALKLLTHEEGVPYMDYVKEIAKNPIARAVKLADLRHNSDRTRIDGEPSERIQAKWKIYAQAMAYLEENP